MCNGLWAAHFVHKKVPFAFVKVKDGLNAIEQLKWNMHTFNEMVDDFLKGFNSGKEPERRKRYHLVPRDAYDVMSSDAQVILKLSNPAGIEKARTETERIVKQKGGDDGGRVPIVAFFDEDDLNVQTCERCIKPTEMALFGSKPGERGFRDMMYQVCSFSATWGAMALSENSKVRVTEIPEHQNYHGLDSFILRELTYESLEGELPQGAVDMIEDMLDGNRVRARMGLITIMA